MLPSDRKVMLRYPFDKCCGRDELGGALRAGVAPEMRWGMAAANDTSPASRIGYDDDGFLCCGPNVSHGDGATFNTQAYGYPSHSTWRSEDGYIVGAGWDYIRAESPYVPMDGEMYGNQGDSPATKPPVLGTEAAHRLFLHHYDTLSMEHGLAAFDNPPKVNSSVESIDVWMRTPLSPAFILKWKLPLEPAYFAGHNCSSPISPTDDCNAPRLATPITEFDYIRDHLGYRLALEEAVFPTVLAADATSFPFRATIINWGFSAPVNSRPVRLTLISSSQQMVINFTVPTDASNWQPMSPMDPMRMRLRHTIECDVKLPASLRGRRAVYRLGLHMPDARAARLDDAAAYAIRLANDNRDVQWWTAAPGLYGERGGVNVIGSVTVAALDPAPAGQHEPRISDDAIRPTILKSDDASVRVPPPPPPPARVECRPLAGAGRLVPQYHALPELRLTKPAQQGAAPLWWPGQANDANAIFEHEGVMHIMFQTACTKLDAQPGGICEGGKVGAHAFSHLVSEDGGARWRRIDDALKPTVGCAF